MRPGIAALYVMAGLAAVVGATADAGSTSPARRVPCSESIDTTRFPYVGDRRPRYRYRLVLGAVSVPPAYLDEVVSTGETPWAYWRKAGVVVQAGGRAVSISVPQAWRGRAAITWGNGGNGVFGSIRLEACPGPATSGLAYAGGFYLRSASACLPLVLRVGVRSRTVRFGLGRRCSA
jgi:hypothetical protein